jgi:hypothetical protein
MMVGKCITGLQATNKWSDLMSLANRAAGTAAGARPSFRLGLPIRQTTSRQCGLLLALPRFTAWFRDTKT